MPLEATMMIIDNSEYMRNGDYQPTRFDAQSDAVNTIFQTKIDSNPENTVGIMTMAGKGPEVLVTHTKDLGQILKAVHSASSSLGGTVDIATAVSIAQLALKHRENKNLRQRIIVLLASPGADSRALVKLAKKLRKNNVALDVVAFGDGVEDHEALKAFVDNASSSDNSHLVQVPPGPHLLSDVVLSSPVLMGDRGLPETGGDDAGTGGGGGGPGFEFGVDPSLDPELAMALRMSMEEEAARLAQEQGSSSSAPAVAPAATPASEPTPAPAPEPAPAAPPASSTPTSQPEQAAPAAEDDEDAQLAAALALSEQKEDVDMEGGEDEDEDEEAAIARAIAMSMKDSSGEEKGK